MSGETMGRESPPPPYSAANLALRLPPRRSNRDSQKIRRMQFLLVIGNWICILAFVAAAIMILVPVFENDLNSSLETTIRVSGYCLMGVIAFTILFLNCVVRRMVVLETLRFSQRQRRRVISTINTARHDGRPIPTIAENVVDIESGHPSAYVGPCGLNDKNEPYGLPSYEAVIAQNPPPYNAEGSDQGPSSDQPQTETRVFTLES